VSDDGVSTLYDTDERGNDGFAVAGQALARARGGGTMVLNLAERWDELKGGSDHPYARIRRARDEQGWNVVRVSSEPELVAFARAFSRLRYGAGAGAHA
jgi:hypothetical protein